MNETDPSRPAGTPEPDIWKFNLYDLLILHHANRPRGTYGYAVQAIAYGKNKLDGSIYRRMGRLAECGYLDLVADQTESTPRLGPPRTSYKTTELGQEVLEMAQVVCLEHFASETDSGPC